jgi:hypothetical protein
MSRRFLKSVAFAAVALSLATISCENSPTDPTQPEITAPAAQLTPPTDVAASLNSTGGYFFVVQPEESTSSGGLLGGLLSFTKQTLDSVLELTKIIGLRGGELSLNRHTLDVPRGAVLVPTAFTMKTNASGPVQVELRATIGFLFGILDVGSNGFLKPVELSLSYAKATNVSYPSHLKIALLNDDGSIREILPSVVDTQKKTVSAKLPHFSRYAMVCD